jgi:adenylosuccinate lyase
MISRYTLPEMGRIWSEQNKLGIWLQVEILACEAQARLGVVPQAALATIKSKAAFDAQRVLEIEEKVKHDVIAFLTNVAEHVGEESRYVHLGMTSSDLLDTSLAVQMKQAGELLQRRLTELHTAVGDLARAHKRTICIGRSHGVHAEPTTFGLKVAVWFAELGRHQERLRRAIENVAVGKISGAVGTFAHLSPQVEEYVCGKLGLSAAPASTQIVQRDRHAEFLMAIALLGASLEKFATEIRSLQRTEILEAEEPFSHGQKGSSSMPHKRNPITCERIAGLARVLRANALTALENVALWHERDITHSSVERITLPDSTILLDYMLEKFTRIVRGLRVYPHNMQKNLERTGGLIYSQAVLLALAKKGMTREEAYRLVQTHAQAVWESGGNFQERLLKDEELRRFLSEQEVRECFSLEPHLQHVDAIFRRVGLEGEQ